MSAYHILLDEIYHESSISFLLCNSYKLEMCNQANKSIYMQFLK
jgi:hypothetical protein